ncbi:hypothetical protein ACFXTO_008593 [Malus domestica]
MKLGFLGPLVLMGKKDLLIDLPFVGEKGERNPLSGKITKCIVPPNVPKLCSCQEFPSGTFPGRGAHSFPGGWRRLRAAVRLLLYCRALSGKASRARLEEKDNVNFERCLCGGLGVGLEAHNQD